MAVPQNKISPARRNKRRSHDGLMALQATACPECGELRRRHQVCPSCGTYKGREVYTAVANEIVEDDE